MYVQRKITGRKIDTNTQKESQPSLGDAKRQTKAPSFGQKTLTRTDANGRNRYKSRRRYVDENYLCAVGCGLFYDIAESPELVDSFHSSTAVNGERQMI